LVELDLLLFEVNFFSVTVSTTPLKKPLVAELTCCITVLLEDDVVFLACAAVADATVNMTIAANVAVRIPRIRFMVPSLI
jgi:hypothetical protein